MGTPRLPEKRWSIDLEKKIQEEHYADESVYQNRYGFKPDSGKPLFVIDTPPPYPSGTWHIGAVAQYSMIDVLARSQRLLGKEVYFPWGVDRNGINIEFTVEKNTKRKMKTYEREEFLDLCRKPSRPSHRRCERLQLVPVYPVISQPSILQMLQIIVRLHNRFSLNFSRKATSLRTCVRTSTILLKGPPSLMRKSNESVADETC